ncbi:MAG: helix-turn-helix transcriptional regulator [Clostridia bacterium]|nr:helix-turn-helix transcriptional regulator [Clostridia bacterium]
MKEQTTRKYYRHKIDNLLVVTRIVTVNYLEFDKHFASEGEAHDFWEMIYAEKGEIDCTEGDNTVVLREGEAHFHRPGEYHRHAVGAHRAPNIVVVCFECRSDGMHFFEGRTMRLSEEERRQLFHIVAEAAATFDTSKGRARLRKMSLLEEPILGGTQVIKNRLELLLIALLRRETSRPSAGVRFLRGGGVGGHIVDHLLARMQENLTAGLSVSELCEGIAYSRSYIFKEFRAATGRSIADHYNAMRVEEAKRLIREGEHTLAEIAELLHFDTPNYFGKAFKRYTGLTPRAYRKQYRTE